VTFVLLLILLLTIALIAASLRRGTTWRNWFGAFCSVLIGFILVWLVLALS
jgi:hypothetical protein